MDSTSIVYSEQYKIDNKNMNTYLRKNERKFNFEKNNKSSRRSHTK